MNFTTTKKILSEAVSNILKAVSTKSTMPALEGILIKTKENQIELTAYDLEIAIKTIIPAEIFEEGEIIITAKIFLDIVRKSPAEKINFAINDKNVTTIKSGQSNFSIIGIDANEFPDLPEVKSDESIKINGELLQSMIRQTIFSVSENDSKPINQGSLFNFEDGIFDLVSVDGFRLALRRENVNMDINTSFVVPAKALSEVIKLATENEIEMIPARRHIMFKIDNYTIISSVLEGEFLDYKNAIPNISKTEIIVNTKKLIESTERVSLIISDRLKSPIRMSFKNDEINLSCSTTLGKANDVLECKITGDDIEMGFNNKYVLDALKYSECDMVKMSIVGSINPLIIKPMEGENFIFLVLPVRIK